MAIKFIEITYEKLNNNKTNNARVEIAVDSAADLVTSHKGISFTQGSIAWDISTGDFYGLDSSGTWKKQSGGGGSSVEFYEVDIDLDIMNEENNTTQISRTYDEIKAAVDSGKIISGTCTIDLTEAGYDVYETAVRGGFDPVSLGEIAPDGAIVLYYDPLVMMDGEATLSGALIVTPDDDIYIGLLYNWFPIAPTRGKSAPKLSTSILDKLKKSENNSEEKK